MDTNAAKIPELVTLELDVLWAAHHAVGLKGFMCLYTPSEQIPFRNKQPGIEFWFGPEDTQSVIQEIQKHYNQGILPNSSLLLNPIVHEKKSGGYAPLGSGI